MPDFKPKPGSFAPYLEYMQRDKREGVMPPPSAATSPLNLLEILHQQVEGALPLPVLQTRSGIWDPARYREALKTLRDAGYISIEGPVLEEIVKLTDKGADIGRLARPA